MGVRLPDATALGRRPVPQGNRAIAQQDTASAGLALARFGQEAGRDIGALVEEQQRRDDEQAVLEYRRKLIEWDRTNVHDAETGAAGVKGKAAFELPKKLAETFDTFAQEAAKDLPSARARRAAQEMAMGRREQITNWATGHAAREREVFDAGEHAANVEAAKNNALMYPTLAAAEIATIKAETQRYWGPRLGPEATAAKVAEHISEVHAGIVTAMVRDGNAAGAEAYFKDNASAMNRKARDMAQAAVKEVGARVKAQTFGDEVQAAGWTLQESLAKARERFSGDEEVAAVAEVKARFNETETARVQTVQALTRESWAAIMANGSMNAIPPDIRAALRIAAPEEERQMRDYLDVKYRRAKADAEGKKHEETPENLRAYLSLRDMAIENPAEFAGMSVEAFARLEPTLTKEHFNKLVELRSGINKNDAKVVQVGQVTQRALTFANQSIAAAGIKMSGASRKPREIEEAEKFKDALFNAIDAEAAAGPVTDQRAKEIAASLLREGIEQGTGGWFFSPKKVREFQMEPGKTYVSKEFDDIPPEDRRGLIEALARRKPLQRSVYGDRAYILTDEDEAEIERAYQRGVQNGVFK